MILIKYDKCPVCAGKNLSSSFKRIKYNFSWLEEHCNNCDFSQFFSHSFKDFDLSYLQFYTDNFHAYIYADKNNHVMAGKTVFYHKAFPPGKTIMGPFQIWNNYMPDFNNLDKLNNKLKILRCFE